MREFIGNSFRFIGFVVVIHIIGFLPEFYESAPLYTFLGILVIALILTFEFYKHDNDNKRVRKEKNS